MKEREKENGERNRGKRENARGRGVGGERKTYRVKRRQRYKQIEKYLFDSRKEPMNREDC